MSNAKIDLQPREDKNGKIYYIGKLEAPMTITLDAKDGVVFMVFVSEEGQEQLQIGPLKKKDRDAAF
jgi:hypothetical protein